MCKEKMASIRYLFLFCYMFLADTRLLTEKVILNEKSRIIINNFALFPSKQIKKHQITILFPL